jgi:hypothetical protein
MKYQVRTSALELPVPLARRTADGDMGQGYGLKAICHGLILPALIGCATRSLLPARRNWLH